MTDEISFSAEEDEVLSALVENIKVIYDNMQYNQIHNSFRSNIWKNIAEEVGRSSDECKKRWKTIQETYILKQRPLAGSAAPKKRIQMSSDLSFLDDDYEGI